MSKYGLEKNLRVAALEFGPHQIRVNAVNPTVTMTEMGKVNTHFVFVFIMCLYLSDKSTVCKPKVGWSDPAKAGPMLAKIPLGR